MSDEFFVGCFAIGLSTVAFASAVGPWSLPYRSRSMASICERYGKKAARLIWLLIAIISAASGVSILNEVRPIYATPAINDELPQ